MYTVFCPLTRPARACEAVEAWNISKTWVKLFYRLQSSQTVDGVKKVYSKGNKIVLSRLLELLTYTFPNNMPWLIFNNENPFKNDITQSELQITS